ncbi:type ISP restriction/modification enzyme [Neisseria animaloris]|uniref:type ISP restriction/modification enzyme n=1 Tax=Neisseria animaloris TaxID=326522 RepID=UPI0039DFE189
MLCLTHRYHPRPSSHRRCTMLPNVPLRNGVINMTICITGLGTSKGFSALITNTVPDVQMQMNGQCFPMFLYETEEA